MGFDSFDGGRTVPAGFVDCQSLGGYFGVLYCMPECYDACGRLRLRSEFVCD